MASLDAPDFQTVITTVESTGDVPDAPDFQEIAVAPGGKPISGGGTSYPGPYSTAQIWEYGFFTMDPCAVTTSAALLSGQVYLAAFVALNTVSVLEVSFLVNSAGTGTADECYIGIYASSASTQRPTDLLGSSAAGVLEGYLSSTGLVSPPFSDYISLTAGTLYYFALLYNGTTCTLLGAAPPNGEALAIGTNLPVFTSRISQSGGYTTLPSPWPAIDSVANGSQFLVWA